MFFLFSINRGRLSSECVDLINLGILSRYRLYEVVLLTGKSHKEKKKERKGIGVSGFVLPFSYPIINVYIQTQPQKCCLLELGLSLKATIMVFPRRGTIGNKLVYNMHIYIYTHIHKHIHGRIKI